MNRRPEDATNRNHCDFVSYTLKNAKKCPEDGS